MVLILLATLLFALSHSLLAGKHSRSFFRQRFGDRAYHGLYRLIYNAIAFFTLGPILLYVYLRGGPVIWIAPQPLEPIMIGVQVIGLVGCAVSLVQIDLGEFTGISQFVTFLKGENLPLPAGKLQTSGLYALVRHPLYLFSLLIIWPVTAMTELLFAFNIVATLYFVLGSLYEERRMIGIYGDDYHHYRQQVPWLVPFVRRRQRERNA